tara:strand:- start:889 stop:1563 length:675 start_codon:yes stop_codon:yes gene_type:complete
VREIVLDTETTGLDPLNGDRLVEIGCIELLNHMETGKYFHRYINPNRSMPSEAQRVHGLSDEFLRDKPKFEEIAEEFMTFLGSSTLIIHNAPFDLGFLNMELKKISHQSLSAGVIDTLTMARKKFPGSPANLDALCRRFEIDLTNRSKHGALLDARLLAEVYLELLGGRQPDLTLDSSRIESHKTHQKQLQDEAKFCREHEATKEELTTHEKFIDSIPNPIWRS